MYHNLYTTHLGLTASRRKTSLCPWVTEQKVFFSLTYLILYNYAPSKVPSDATTQVTCPCIIFYVSAINNPRIWYFSVKMPIRLCYTPWTSTFSCSAKQVLQSASNACWDLWRPNPEKPHCVRPDCRVRYVLRHRLI